MKNNNIKNVSKATIKKVEDFDNKLKLGNNYYLSNILTNVKSFLYDFIYFYEDIRVKGNVYPCINGKCYKFIYEDELVIKMGKSKATVSKKINILTTLGLIEKLNVYDKKYNHCNIDRAIKSAINNKKKTVLFFYIPNYTRKLLKSANDKAEKLIEQNFSIKRFNKNFVIKVFGQDFANEIFLDKRKIPKIYYEQIKDIRNILIKNLNKKDIVSLIDFKDIIYKKYLHCKDNKFKTNAIDNNIKDVINELLKERIIQRRRLTKKEKGLYDMEIKDYRYFILKGESWKYE